MEDASGRGWAVLQDDGPIRGKLSLHQGDKSGFGSEEGQAEKVDWQIKATGW